MKTQVNNTIKGQNAKLTVIMLFVLSITSSAFVNAQNEFNATVAEESFVDSVIDLKDWMFDAESWFLNEQQEINIAIRDWMTVIPNEYNDNSENYLLSLQDWMFDADVCYNSKMFIFASLEQLPVGDWMSSSEGWCINTSNQKSIFELAMNH